ncbi:hypothetical protein HNQ90_002271 [Algibacter amylolyticus]|nr:hypothetical protein [Algibacter amylolyticus]
MIKLVVYCIGVFKKGCRIILDNLNEMFMILFFKSMSLIKNKSII